MPTEQALEIADTGPEILDEPSGVLTGQPRSLVEERELAPESLALGVLGLELLEESIRGPAALHRIGEVRHAGLDGFQLPLERRAPVSIASLGRADPLHGPGDRLLDNPLLQHLTNRRQYGSVEGVLGDEESVRADVLSPVVVILAAVEFPPALPLEVPRHRSQRSSALRTPRDAGEQVGRLEIAHRWPGHEATAGAAHVRIPGLLEAGLRGLPDLLRDDAQLGRLVAHPRRLRLGAVGLAAPLIPFLDLAPRHHTPVEIAEQDLADGGGRPAGCTPRRRDPLSVQRLGDAGDARAFRAEAEDPLHHRGLLGFHDADHVLAGAIRPEYRLVAIAVDPAARDMECPRLPEHGFVRPLPGPLPLHLVREGDDGEQHLVGGRVDGALPVVEVQEHPHPGLAELLERVGRLDLLAPEAGLLGHDEHLKGRSWLERGHEPEEAGAGGEFGA